MEYKSKMEIELLATLPNKNRWAILGKQSLLQNRDLDQTLSQPSIQWEDFEHSISLQLSYNGTTCIAFRKMTYESVVLKSCESSSYTSEKKFLVELGRVNGNIYFISTVYTFTHRKLFHVASEIFDISLADLIDCTIQFKEIHISTVLGQISRALHYLTQYSSKAGCTLIYGQLTAAQVFISRDGTVKLATFGSQVKPEKSVVGNLHKDRWDLGALATHMLSQSAAEPSIDASQQRIIATSSLGRRLDAKCEPSPGLIDFLEVCFMHDGMFDKVLKHPFLREQCPQSLTPLVLNAERLASRPCYSL